MPVRCSSVNGSWVSMIRADTIGVVSHRHPAPVTGHTLEGACYLEHDRRPTWIIPVEPAGDLYAGRRDVGHMKALFHTPAP